MSGDTDFGTLLALRNLRSPSVILFRSRNMLIAEDHVAIIRDYLDDLESDLDAGAVVVVTDNRIRVRLLPLLHDI